MKKINTLTANMVALSVMENQENKKVRTIFCT